MELGLVIVFAGFIFLMRNLGMIPADALDWSILWPIFIILLGLIVIGKGHRHHMKCHPCKGETCEDCKKKA
ncbi:TPA: hypothetical protein DCQ44_00430 [Candidatus Taylorbacteria bacterium]|nr:hypothetical protein [Candidatus Taylorbacteria bacterium]